MAAAKNVVVGAFAGVIDEENQRLIVRVKKILNNLKSTFALRYEAVLSADFVLHGLGKVVILLANLLLSR